MKKITLIFTTILFIFNKSIATPPPALDWAKGVGGNSSNTNAFSVSLDNSGNVYTVGEFSGTVDFDPSSSGIFNLTSNGGTDIFLTKFNSSGVFINAFKIGGPLDDRANCIKSDGLGHIYITGIFKGSLVDFDPTSGTSFLSSAGDADVFVLKLDYLLNFSWANSMGGTGYDDGESLAFDTSKNFLYTTGGFSTTAYFNSPAPFISSGDMDIFVCKLTSNGNFVWAKTIGNGTGIPQFGRSIEVDGKDDVYSTGSFSGNVDFNPSPTLTNSLTAFSPQTYILKLSSTGNFIWAKQIGQSSGSPIVDAHSLALDNSSNVFVCGEYLGSVDFDPNIGTKLFSSISTDIFVCKLNISGELVWVNSFGNTGDDYSHAICIDKFGNSFITGFFTGNVDFDPEISVYNLTSGLYGDSFISKYDADGHFRWAVHNNGPSSNSSGQSITIDPTCKNIIAVGSFEGTTDFDPSVGLSYLIPSGYKDAFIMKLSQTNSLELNLFLEGYYDVGSHSMQPALFNQSCTFPSGTVTEADMITIELHNLGASTPILNGSISKMLNINGTIDCDFSSIVPGNYYVAVYHRNSILTTSSSVINIGTNPVSYNFSSSMPQAFQTSPTDIAQKMIEPPTSTHPNGLWAFYTGDINQDENVDGLDDGILHNDIVNFVSGCTTTNTDLSGDGNSALDDQGLLDNNVIIFAHAMHPW